MHASVFSWWPLLLAATATGPAGAQSAPPPASPLPYRSAFEGYPAFDEQPVAPWKASNDTVARIGGWRAYAQEAQAAQAASGSQQPPGAGQPAPAAAPAAAAAPTKPGAPRAASHGHHH